MNKRICLFNLEQLAIIVPEQTRACYFNHCGPKSDQLQECEGLLVPLSDDQPNDEEDTLSLCEHLDQLLANGETVRGRVHEINNLLQALSCSDSIGVSPTELDRSYRGWIYVSVSPWGDFSQFEGFDDFTGVLTWRPVDRSP